MAPLVKVKVGCDKGTSAESTRLPQLSRGGLNTKGTRADIESNKGGGGGSPLVLSPHI